MPARSPNIPSLRKMVTQTFEIDIAVGNQSVSGTLLSPPARLPGVLFVHGWGASQQPDLDQARELAGLGCICLTFDLRGHARDSAQQQVVTREDNLRDLLTAYDLLAAHQHVDPQMIAVVGSSYGAYLATILTMLRPVKWLSLRVPALYEDSNWDTPKAKLERVALAQYRRRSLAPGENLALHACTRFEGDVLLVESENDDFVPPATIRNYRHAFAHVHSMTYRIIDGADHGLTSKTCQKAYSSVLINWATEMIAGERRGR
ncbi:alpha/beta hydrolase family protein [Labrys okinawensis]|nr:alpha/beta fold hydrolase [Labrys okinawensis]